MSISACIQRRPEVRRAPLCAALPDYLLSAPQLHLDHAQPASSQLGLTDFASVFPARTGARHARSSGSRSTRFAFLLSDPSRTTTPTMLRAQQSYPPVGQGSPARAVAPPPLPPQQASSSSSSPAPKFTQRASAFLSNRSVGSARTAGSGSGGKMSGQASVRSSGSGGSDYARNADPADLFVREDRIGELVGGLDEHVPPRWRTPRGRRCVRLRSRDAPGRRVATCQSGDRKDCTTDGSG